MTTWKLKSARIELDYEVADAPDLQDSRSSRRMVLRPRRATLYLLPNTNQVYGAVIEGRQVRRDSELAGSKMILCGIETSSWGYSNPAPAWLNKILADKGLEWTARR